MATAGRHAYKKGNLYVGGGGEPDENLPPPYLRDAREPLKDKTKNFEERLKDLVQDDDANTGATATVSMPIRLQSCWGYYVNILAFLQAITPAAALAANNVLVQVMAEYGTKSAEEYTKLLRRSLVALAAAGAKREKLSVTISTLDASLLARASKAADKAIAESKEKTNRENKRKNHERYEQDAKRRRDNPYDRRGGDSRRYNDSGHYGDSYGDSGRADNGKGKGKGKGPKGGKAPPAP